MGAPSPAPGWYPDPSGAPGQRYFDGQQWTIAAPSPAAKSKAGLWIVLAIIAVPVLFFGGCATLVAIGMHSDHSGTSSGDPRDERATANNELLTADARHTRGCLSDRNVTTDVRRVGRASSEAALAGPFANAAARDAEAELATGSGGPRELPGGGVADAPISSVELFFYADVSAAEAAANRVEVSPEPSNRQHVTEVDRFGRLVLVHSSIDFASAVAQLSPEIKSAVQDCAPR
jgi:hypothetical protein